MKRQPHVLRDQSGLSIMVILLGILLVGLLIAALWVSFTHHSKPKTTTTTTSSLQQKADTSKLNTGCKTSDLKLSQGTTDGTAGTAYTHAVITNTSGHSCTVRAGYPSAALLDGSGNLLGSTAAVATTYTPSILTIAAGATAYTAIGFPDPNAFSGNGACSAQSTTMQIYVPGTNRPLEIPWVAQYCPGFSVTAMQLGS